jgi:hypothetical protein
VLISALAGLVLVAAPLTAMVVYRSLHPVYIYHLPQPATTPAVPVLPPAQKTGKSTKPQNKPGTSAHKPEAAKPQLPVGVWPQR